MRLDSSMDLSKSSAPPMVGDKSKFKKSVSLTESKSSKFRFVLDGIDC